MSLRFSVVFAAWLGVGCATTTTTQRVKDSVPERVAASKEATRRAESEADEERFATEKARALRDERKAREAERRKRADVVGKKEAPPK